ncbi:hypothetical protein Hanom_Chr03g00197501 [Helianthus anomalus]
MKSGNPSGVAVALRLRRPFRCVLHLEALIRRLGTRYLVVTVSTDKRRWYGFRRNPNKSVARVPPSSDSLD